MMRTLRGADGSVDSQGQRRSPTYECGVDVAQWTALAERLRLQDVEQREVAFVHQRDKLRELVRRVEPLHHRYFGDDDVGSLEGLGGTPHYLALVPLRVDLDQIWRLVGSLGERGVQRAYPNGDGCIGPGNARLAHSSRTASETCSKLELPG